MRHSLKNRMKDYMLKQEIACTFLTYCVHFRHLTVYPSVFHHFVSKLKPLILDEILIPQDEILKHLCRWDMNARYHPVDQMMCDYTVSNTHTKLSELLQTETLSKFR